MRKVEIPNDILLSSVRQLIEEGHTATIRVKGISMRPFLENERDSVVLAAVTRLETGDVVLAEIARGQYVLHRIIKMDGTSLTLMGDGNLKGTESCDTADIAGIVTAFIRKGKRVECSSRRWRVYSKIWLSLRPLRRYLLFIYRW
jgi:hypothetical protein